MNRVSAGLGPAAYAVRVIPFLLFFFAALVICPAVGSVDISLARALDRSIPLAENLDASILFLTRLPRILLAALAGSGLALAGAAFQSLLRNPLATPFTLGVSSGGSLGAVIAIKMGLGVAILGFPTVPLFAFTGSLLTVGLVYFLARSRDALPTSILLLAGVTVAFFFSAMILFAHYLSDFTESYQMIRWLMGGLDVIGYRPILGILPLWLIGSAAILGLARHLNLLSFGPQQALALGVDVARSQRICFIAASLVTGAVVSLAGPIGFVGLIVPHAVRLLIGPDYRVLLPASLFAGAGFLIACDTVARIVIAPAEIPVGVLTAAIGGPFFIAILFREKRRLAVEDG